ncbi:hypothetical protein C8J57DRAFT_1354906 [Mycena rebaudengoi]|nr:hypothetical protein C8J57DRAFT_1354906 [Mycena rebaudengoi]
MSLPALPQELIDKIIAELEDDRQTLIACALVSQSFLPSARACLYSSVRLGARNVYNFRQLLDSSPAVGKYIRRLEMPRAAAFPASVLLPPETLAHLPNLAHLLAHCDPFGWRQLSVAQKLILRSATRALTTVHVVVDRTWTLPEWAELLNGCPYLHELTIHAESAGWSTWTQQQVNVAMPTALSGEDHPRLRVLEISGDCKILQPLGAWLVPSGYLDALRTLAIDLVYLVDDYFPPDWRLPIVLTAASSLQVLSLHFDPPMALKEHPHPVSLSQFPVLRVLHLKDGPDAKLMHSLEWLVALLQTLSTDQHMHPCVLEEISFDHAVTRGDMAEIPAETWTALDALLLMRDTLPRFQTLTFLGYQKSSIAPQRHRKQIERTVNRSQGILCRY